MNENCKIIGDRHNGKATELINENGCEFIRKPRGAANELAWEAFLHEIEREGFFSVPDCVKIIAERADGHDVKIVKHRPSNNENEVSGYYEKCGALLFFCYLFGSTDLHCENIICNGSSPVVVDLETLLSGEVQRAPKQYSLAKSVLASHLLPNWSGETDCGGLTGDIEGCKNKPFFDGKAVEAYDYESEIVHGFTRAHTFACANREKLDELLRLFDGCEFRVLLRPTSTYGQILSLLEKFKDADTKRSFACALLKRAYENDSDPQRFEKCKAAYEAEVSAVVNGDVPLFYSKGNETHLMCCGATVQKNFLALSPVDATRKRLRKLNEVDLITQTKIISRALAAKRPSVEFIAHRTTVLDDILSFVERTYIPALPSGEMMLEYGRDGTVYLQSAGLGLYDGLTGTMCFCASVYRKAGSAAALELLKKLFDRYTSAVQGMLPCRLTADNAGLQSGISGHLQALIHIEQLTDDNSYSLFAESLAKQIITSPDAKYSCNDVLCGIAGLALTLPKLTKKTALPLAEHSATALADCETALTGAAHGAAGIAAALGAIQFVLGGSRFDSKILALLETENKHFCSEESNWYDLRNPERKGFMGGWCSGAPGVGMARQLLLKYTNNKRIVEICLNDIAASKKMIYNNILCKRDSLCCGSASRLMAASTLGVELPELYTDLTDRASSGKLRLFSPLESGFINPGLMQGISGVGYALAMYKDGLCGGMLV